MLALEKEFPACVLAKGTQAELPWVVMRNDWAFRCGYVRAPCGHPWHGRPHDQLAAAVHGGLTYSAPAADDDGWWLGFDCGHGADAPDPALPSAWPLPDDVQWPGRVWTQPEVETECRRLCEQAAAAASTGRG